MGVTKVGYLTIQYYLDYRGPMYWRYKALKVAYPTKAHCRWLPLLHYWLLSITFKSRVHRGSRSRLGYLSDERPIVGGCRLLSWRPETEIFETLWICNISSFSKNLQILIKSSTHLDLWPVGATWMTGAPCLKPPRRRSAERDLRRSIIWSVFLCTRVCVCVCVCV